MERQFQKTVISSKPFDQEWIDEKINKVNDYFGIDKGEYLVHQIERSLLPYNAEKQPILLLNNDGTKVALDQSENQILSSSITAVNQKFVLTFPREVQ